jgi:hypothetical protein
MRAIDTVLCFKLSRETSYRLDTKGANIMMREYPHEEWAIRLKAGGYEPTPMGLEKLMHDLWNAKKTDREIQSKGLFSFELDKLGEIKKITEAAQVSLPQLKDWLTNWKHINQDNPNPEKLKRAAALFSILEKEQVTADELAQLLKIRDVLKERKVKISAENIETLINSYRSSRENTQTLAATVLGAVTSLHQNSEELNHEIKAGQAREEELEKRIESLREMNSSKTGGCYVATAALTCGDSDSRLNPLREWRDNTLRLSKFGRSLEAYYDLIGPQTATKLRNNRLLALSCLLLFVKPALLLSRVSRTPTTSIRVSDLAMYTLFICGLAYGKVILLLGRPHN